MVLLVKRHHPQDDQPRWEADAKPPLAQHDGRGKWRGGDSSGFLDGHLHIYPRLPTRWCPSSLAKLVNITPITMVYGRYNELVNGGYKPTYNWRAPSCKSPSLIPEKKWMVHTNPMIRWFGNSIRSSLSQLKKQLPHHQIARPSSCT